MKIIIKKAKIAKGRTVDVTYTEKLNDDTEREHSVNCQQLFHNDLQAAFDKLIPHLIMICDQKGSDEIKKLGDLDEISEEMISGYSVQSFSISGTDENEGVTIVGQKRYGDKVINLITPFAQYQDENYRFGNELSVVIASCVYEVEEYLKGKYAVKQLEMDFDEKDPDSPEFDQEANTVATAVLSEVIKEKRGKRKKVEAEQLQEAI